MAFCPRAGPARPHHVGNQRLQGPAVPRPVEPKGEIEAMMTEQDVAQLVTSEEIDTAADAHAVVVASLKLAASEAARVAREAIPEPLKVAASEAAKAYRDAEALATVLDRKHRAAVKVERAARAAAKSKS